MQAVCANTGVFQACLQDFYTEKIITRLSLLAVLQLKEYVSRDGRYIAARSDCLGITVKT